MNMSNLRAPVGVYIAIVMWLAALVVWPLALGELKRSGVAVDAVATVSDFSVGYKQTPASQIRASTLASQINSAFLSVRASAREGGQIRLVASEPVDYSAWFAAVGWMALTSDSKSVVRTKSVCVNACTEGFAVADFELVEIRFSISR
jgi:hypothetical protein